MLPAEAERRWTRALHDRFAQCPVTYAEIVDLIDTSLREAANDAELRRPGSGLLHILRELRIPAAQVTGFAPKGSRI